MRQEITNGQRFRLTIPSSTLRELCCTTRGSGSAAIEDSSRRSQNSTLVTPCRTCLVVFEESRSLREDADYELVHSEQGAGEALEDAEIFFERSKMILRDSIDGHRRARVQGEDLLSYLEKSKDSRGAISKRTRKHQAPRGRRQKP